MEIFDKNKKKCQLISGESLSIAQTKGIASSETIHAQCDFIFFMSSIFCNILVKICNAVVKQTLFTTLFSRESPTNITPNLFWHADDTDY
jgi:hypothetical protein